MPPAARLLMHLGLASALLAPSLAGAPEEAEMGLASLLPLNVPIHDFRLPQYDEEGQLASIIEVDQLRRISDARFALRELRIRLFENGKEVRTITTPQARFYLKHRFLAGDHLVHVERPGESTPEATGRGFVYDLDTRTWGLLSEVTARLPLKQAQEKSMEIEAAQDSSEK